MARVKKIKCPECGDFFELDDYLEVGEITACPMCDVSLLVVDLNPPLVKVADSEESDGFDLDENDEYEEENEDNDA